MNSYYIYKAELINKEPKSITVIYNPNNQFNFDSLGKELKELDMQIKPAV